MLLQAKDQASFWAKIEMDGAEYWARYSVEGSVNGQAVTQADKKMFASEEQARAWVVAEGEKRGFKDVKPEMPN